MHASNMRFTTPMQLGLHKHVCITSALLRCGSFGALAPRVREEMQIARTDCMNFGGAEAHVPSAPAPAARAEARCTYDLTCPQA